MSNLITRRQALTSLAGIAAGALFKPLSIFGAEPVKGRIRFPVIGDWGTGDGDQNGIARQMYSAHLRSPFDFIISAGDNIYPNGSGRHFGKNFERPFANFLAERVNFHVVLGNHDVREGRQDQCHYPHFNMGGRSYYTIQQGGGLIELFMLDSTDCDPAQLGWLEHNLKTSTARSQSSIIQSIPPESGMVRTSNYDEDWNRCWFAMASM
jgi:hypothetical protein